MGIHKSCILLLVICICFNTEVTQVRGAIGLFDKYYVHIINGFSDVTIGVHCQSKDNDLGEQFVPVGGEFQWNFRTNFFGTTLFFCHIWWTEGHVTYKAYWDNEEFKRESCGDGHCRWKADTRGISNFNVRQNVYQLLYLWEH
ncbi:unnamed protein product [Citrullus colocynthis]|uniref:S-protein homolog n=1 Tax=Citrullus colocynthis TaxID=252529 RepID=A0ABP0XQU3_9ROSI